MGNVRSWSRLLVLIYCDKIYILYIKTDVLLVATNETGLEANAEKLSTCGLGPSRECRTQQQQKQHIHRK
jgi:hypothetical protein